MLVCIQRRLCSVNMSVVAAVVRKANKTGYQAEHCLFKLRPARAFSSYIFPLFLRPVLTFTYIYTRAYWVCHSEDLHAVSFCWVTAGLPGRMVSVVGPWLEGSLCCSRSERHSNSFLVAPCSQSQRGFVGQKLMSTRRFPDEKTWIIWMVMKCI